MKRILVTGAGGPAGVNFIRSLRAAPEPFYIIAADCCRHHLAWPDADERHVVPRVSVCEEYFEAITALVDVTGAEFLHYQVDAEVSFWAGVSNWAERGKSKLATVELCADKGCTAHAWGEAGLVGIGAISGNVAGLSSMLGAMSPDRRYWLRATTGAGARASTLVENAEMGVAWLQYWGSRTDCPETFVVHEYLPGRDYAWQSVWRDGKLLCSQARERLEYIYPHLAPSGRTGTPTVAKTVHNEAVNEVATKAVQVIDDNATGIFCVDLREDKDGIPRPTEINCGRFFTTSEFFTRAGCNMPYIYVKSAFDELDDLGDLPQYNACPEGLLWLRHIDCPAQMMTEEELDGMLGSPESVSSSATSTERSSNSGPTSRPCALA